MAVTNGHGNPNWTRDETILALDTYFATRDRNPSPRDPAIIALSNTLRSLPYHSEAARKPTFRNPDGAAFKVQNLRSVGTGKGLGNVSAMDRAVWAELGDKPAEVSRLARLIRSQLSGTAGAEAANVDDAEEFYEGRLLTQTHSRRERSRKVRERLLVKREQSSGLKCDVCDASYVHLAIELQRAAFEAHHVIPVSEAGEGTTKLSDMALLCATCHRLLHRLIASRRAWVSISDARGLLAA